MRKKYLSALLFGALLLASAGTFTSCKDYDDDIKNLQEQINTVKTSLDELTTKVNNLGAGIKDFKYENGQLVIVTDKDTNFTVDLPACEGITNLEIKDGVLYADGKPVGNVAGDGGSVVEVKDGVIYIDGKAVAEIGNKVAIVDNGNGTYTLTVDGKEYTLPKASAAIYGIELANNNFYEVAGYSYFTEDYLSTSVNTANTGINWGVAAEDLANWTGPKGAIKKGQLLVGAINTLDVVVTPKNADLSQAKLTLVDTKGVEAPVKVTPKRVEDSDMLNPGSRAVSADGTWTLSVETTATAEEMATAYAGTDENGVARNLKYALAVDGVVMTDYEFSVDTWTAKEVEDNDEKVVPSATKLMFGDDAATGTGKAYSIAKVNLGKTQLTYKDASVYDVQVDIAPESIEDAELLGVELDKNTNTLSVSDKAANNSDKKIKLNVTLLGVNGLKSETVQVTINSFGTTSVDDKQTIGTTEYTMTTSTAKYAKNIIIDMEDVFSSLSAEQSTDLVAPKWACDDLASSITATYYGSLEDAKAMKNPINTDDDTAGRVRSIKYAVIAVSDYATTFKSTAKAGKYDLDVTLSTSKGEIKKVVAPVNITLPAFDSIFTKTNDGLWTEEGRVVTLADGLNVTLSGIFESTTVDANNSVKVASMKYTNNADKEQNVGKGTIIGGAIALTNIVNNNGFLTDTTLDTKVEYAFTAAMKIESSFVVLVKSQFANPSLVYYSNKVAATTAVLNGDNMILGGTVAGTGLALKYNGKEVAALDKLFNGQEEIGGFKLNASTASDKQVKYDFSLEGFAVDCDVTVTEKGIQLTPKAGQTQIVSGQTGTLVITFTDSDNIKTEAKISFVKQ